MSANPQPDLPDPNAVGGLPSKRIPGRLDVPPRRRKEQASRGRRKAGALESQLSFLAKVPGQPRSRDLTP